MYFVNYTMEALHLAILFLLLRVVWSEVAFSRSESSDVSYENLYHHEDYKLLGVKINEVRVKSPVECLIRCIETNKCLFSTVRVHARRNHVRIKESASQSTQTIPTNVNVFQVHWEKTAKYQVTIVTTYSNHSNGIYINIK
jgi:hypothetical protein